MASGETTPLLNSVPSTAVVSGNRVRQRFITIEPMLMINAIVVTSFIPSLQQYIYTRLSQDLNYNQSDSLSECSNHSNPNYIKQQEVQAEATTWLTYYNLCSIFIAFFSTIFLGGYSDRGGRKIALVCPTIGSLLKLYVTLGIMIYELPIYLLLIAGVLEGIFGGWCMFLMATFSYISDVTTSKQRSMRIIVLEMCTAVGCAIAYVSSGYSIRYLGYTGTTLLLHVLTCLNLFLIIFTIPETVRKVQGLKFWTLDHFKESFIVYTKNDGHGRRSVLLCSILIMFIMSMAQLGKNDVTIMFVLDAPLCWNSVLYGYYRAYEYLITCLGSMLLVKFLQPVIGDLPLIIVSSLCAATSCVYMAYTRTTTMMFMVPLMEILSLLPIGLLRAFNSKVVKPDELGAMFSWIAWMELIGSLVGDVSYNTIYKATLTWFRGFVFITLGITYFTGGLITLILLMCIIKSGFIKRLASHRCNEDHHDNVE